MWTAGVDGCPGGWCVVCVAPQTQEIVVQLCPDFGAVLALRPRPDFIAIDIPIGLLDERQAGGRECDRLARRRLPGRASSVFSPPVRGLLGATRYRQVRSHGLSIQAFGIVAKIREVDRLMTSALQGWVYEAHPELAFRSLAGAPMRYSKKTSAGREERLQALERLASFRAVRDLLETVATRYRRSQVAFDDFLDACVLAWLAGRIAAGTAQRLPAEPLLDAKGLRMEIWYSQEGASPSRDAASLGLSQSAQHVYKTCKIG